MRFTLSQAAKEAGVSKGTLSKALQSGRMSGERREDGSFQIEPAELFRVFPRKPQEPRPRTDGKPTETTQATPGERAETAAEMAELRATVRLLERERETILVTVDDLRRALQEERDERRALQRQLMPPAAPQMAQESPSASLAALEPSRRSKGLLSRLMGW